LISSEGSLPEELKANQIKIKPEHLHHFLAFATLYVGEGATTASECAVLGTPNIYVNSLTVGYCKEQQEKYGLCNHLKNENGVIEKAIEIIDNKNIHQQYQTSRQVMLKDKIDGTAFLVWFVENYPQSEEIMRKNPDFQYNFR
jgi:predicted glycosyltransferase